MRIQIFIALTITILSLCSCSFAQTATLTEKQRFELAAQYSRESRGLSVLVMKGDKIVFEDYQNGHTADRPLESGKRDKIVLRRYVRRRDRG